MSESLTGLVVRGRRLLADYALLGVLEVRSAVQQLAWALAGVLVAAVLLVTAWLACVVAAVGWFVGSEASWPLALLAAALANLFGAGLLLAWMRGRLTAAPFAAILRQLRGDPAGEPEEGSSS